MSLVDLGLAWQRLFGAMLGALTLGSLADRLGQRWMLVGAVWTFSLFSLLTPFAPSLQEYTA